MARANLQRGRGSVPIQRWGVFPLARGKGQDLVSRLRVKAECARRIRELVLVQWQMDVSFAVEVRKCRMPRSGPTSERIRYVKLGTGLSARRPPGGSAGLHWNRRTGFLDS